MLDEAFKVETVEDKATSWTRPSAMKPPMLDEAIHDMAAILDEAANAGLGF